MAGGKLLVGGGPHRDALLNVAQASLDLCVTGGVEILGRYAEGLPTVGHDLQGADGPAMPGPWTTDAAGEPRLQLGEAQYVIDVGFTNLGPCRLGYGIGHLLFFR